MGCAPAFDPAGQTRKTDMRSAINAILYLLSTGCPWRYLPRDGFPPRSTVYNISRGFQKDGVWDGIWDKLRMELREDMDREASPTAAIIDSQSLKSAETYGPPRLQDVSFIWLNNLTNVSGLAAGLLAKMEIRAS